MGLGKTYSTQYLADSNNNTGAAGQVLISTSTGVNWSDGTDIIGGPYLPLSAGLGFPLSGKLYAQDDIYISGEHVIKNIDTNLYLDSASGHSILLRPGGSEKVRIQASGNVGIGTTSPGAKLEVSNGSSGFTGSYNGRTASVFEGSNSAGTTISIMSPSTGYSGLFFGDESNEAEGQIQYNHSESAFKFLNGGGSERMRISSGGNVGIGTTSPTVMLQVDGNAYIGTGATDDNLSLRVYGNNVGVSKYIELAHTNASSSRVKTTNSYLSLESSGYILLSQSGLFYGDTLILNNKRIKYGESNGGWRDVMYLGTDNVFRIGTISTMSSGGDTAMYHSGSEKVRINSAGVGIGTTSPDSPLEVQFDEATGTAKQILHLDYNPVDNYGSALFKISSGTSANNIFEIEQVTGGGAGDFGTYLDTNIINRNVSSGAYGNINFVTGSDTSVSSIVMTIGGGTQKGNVGIGTTSPLVKLQVHGNPMPAAADAASVEDMLTLYRNGSSTVWAGGASLSLGRYSAGGSSPKSRLDFKLKAAAGSNTALPELTVMTMNSDGRVGIGTTSPDFKLDVAGDVRIENLHGLYFGGDTSTTFKWGMASSGADLVINNNTTNGDVTFINDGNVGIGTTSTSQKLEVMGGVVVNSGFNTGIASLYLSHTNPANPQHKAGIFTTYISGYGRSSSMQFALNDQMTGDIVTTADAKMTILENGNVGIGTTSPGYKLEVNAGNGIFVGDGGAPVLEANSSTGLFKIGDTDELGDGVYLTNDTGGNLDMYSSGSIKVRMDVNGNVGIGTISPNFKLEVLGNSRFTDTLNVNASALGAYIYSSQSIGLRVRGGGNSNDIAQFQNVGGSTVAVIDSTGDVGIGMTSPATTLDVLGTYRQINAAAGAAGGTVIARTLTYSTSPYGLVTRAYSNGLFTIQCERESNAGENFDMALQPTGGYLGVGTVSPSYKLDVSGAGRFTSTVTAANFILSSDERKKTKIKDLERNNINANWKSFEMKNDEGEYRTGVIAQELEETHPEFVNTDPEGFKSVKYIDLLIAKIAELEARLEKLEK